MDARMRRPNRRRQWLIVPPIQLRFVRAILLMTVGIAILVLASVYLALWVTLTTFELQHDRLTLTLFRNVALSVTVELLVMAPVLLWLFTLIGIRIAHRFAGPLIKIMVAVDQLARGNFDVRLEVRKDDALADLSEDINRLAESLRKRPPG
jgi:methyl-accepting chemotaxis protein